MGQNFRGKTGTKYEWQKCISSVHSQTVPFDLTCTEGTYNKVLKFEVTKWAWSQALESLKVQTGIFMLFFC